MAFSYGKLDPHAPETHPRVLLRDYLGYEAIPPVVDWASRVALWPMYLNDRLGDCTCAAIGHMIQAWTAYGKGTIVTLPQDDVLSLYEAVAGYNPATGANDNGAVEQTVLQYVQTKGIGGHTIRAFAQVNHTDPIEMKRALDLFGSVYLGIQVPQSAETQFDAGQPWTYVAGQQIVGGHAVPLQKWDADYMYVVTWGKLQPMTGQFWGAYGDEAWVIITDDWLNAVGVSPTGLDLKGLLADFDALNSPAPVAPASKGGFWGWLKRLFRNW